MPLNLTDNQDEGLTFQKQRKSSVGKQNLILKKV